MVEDVQFASIPVKYGGGVRSPVPLQESVWYEGGTGTRGGGKPRVPADRLTPR